ncbi:protein kinase [Saccharomonospora xinjiangensis]|uniref:protein kinase domain-containing protein n=1 Tax=Saccharomonospora xinjiangensis TaxID=75294 RepID=UPI00106F5115|nr:protein kinase [Saccharomonospora xinjiangensis]QBQ61267.1 Serine/threonine-protein kinase PrkC [Saccharomonospora xinjiangensis]
MAIWLPGQVVHGLYEVRDVITSGGMGVVYHVWHRGWNVDLAVKVPRPGLVASREAVRGFEAEAQRWVELAPHPHVVDCVYVRRLADLPHVFAEWADGGSLADAIRTRRLHRGGLPALLDVAVQSAWGLAHAHASGLIHQDVKPANILLLGDGTAKITDFGLARARVAAGERPSGSELVSCGGLTPAYCSPEQARAARGEGIGLTRATDVWSWALSVVEMFTGRPPVRDGELAADALSRLAEGAGDDPVIPRMPTQVVELLARCFAPDPGERPSDLTEVADDLAGVYEELTGQPYSRQQPPAARLLADGLSNRALSLLDLGLADRAERLWDDALRADPHHPHTVYNRGLHHWRAGRLSDARLVARMEEMRENHEGDWIDDYLLGLVHLERGDREKALALLSSVAKDAGNTPEITAAVEAARALPPVPEPIVLGSGQDWSAVSTVSADGRVCAGSVTDAGSGQWSVRAGRSGRAGQDGERGVVRVWRLDTAAAPRTFPSHAGRLYDLGLSADGSVLASCGQDGEILVWDTGAGTLRHRIPSPSGAARSVAVSPEGTSLVAAADDGAVWLWDLEDGSLVRTVQRPHTTGFGIAVAMTERRVVRWESHHVRIRVWDPAGRLLRVLRLPRSTALLSPGGRFALVGAESGLEVWDTEEAALVRVLPLDTKDIRPRAISGDGRTVLLSTPAETQVWSLDEDRCVRALPHTCEHGALDAQGRRAVIGNDQLTALPVPKLGPSAAWSYPRHRSATEYTTVADRVRRALRRADRRIADGALTGAARVLRQALTLPGYERNRELLDRWAHIGRKGRRTGVLTVWQRFELPHAFEHRVSRTASADEQRWLFHAALSRHTLSRDGSALLTGDVVWDMSTGRRLLRLSAEGTELRGRTLSPDGTTAVAGCADRRVRVWDTGSGRLRAVLTGHRDEVVAVAVSADGALLVSACRRRKVRVWDLASGACLRVLSGFSGEIDEVAFSHDARLVFAVGKRGTAAVWDTETGRFLRIMPGKPRHVGPWLVSVDGGTAMSVGFGERTLWVVDPRTQDFRDVLTCNPEPVLWLAVSADGRRAHTAGEDGAVRVFAVAEGELAAELTGHDGAVRMLAPCADDRFTLSCGDDGTVRVWDLDAGTCLRTLAGHTNEVVWLGLSADARTAVSVGVDHTVVWRLEWDYEFPQPSDWHEAARPHVEAFLARAALGRVERGTLFDALADAGLGWLRTEEIERRAAR